MNHKFDIIRYIYGDENSKWIKTLNNIKETREALLESIKAKNLLGRIKEADGFRHDLLDELLEIVKENKNVQDRIQAGKEFWEEHVKDLNLGEIWTLSIILTILNINIYASLDQINSVDPKVEQKAQSKSVDSKKLMPLDRIKNIYPDISKCFGIPVPDEVEQTVTETLLTVLESFNEITDEPNSLQDHLAQYERVDQLNNEIIELKNSIKPQIIEAIRSDVGEFLVGKGVPEFLVDEYLDEPGRGETRIFENSNLFLNEHLFTQITKAIRTKRDTLRDNMLSKILNDYESIDNPGKGDCFFYSCAQQPLIEKKDHKAWRRAISKQLRNPKYLDPIRERINHPNEMIPKNLRGGNEQEKYCNWINQEGNWASAPELQAFSDIVQRPVIVIHTIIDKKDGTIYRDWGVTFNMTDEEPLIFNHNGNHYEAMIKKVK